MRAPSVVLLAALAWPQFAAAEEPGAKPGARPAVVQVKGPARTPTRSWFGLNAGIVSGNVEVPCSGVGPPDGCSEGGVFPTLGLNFTVTGKHALRLRAVRAEEENTRHKPYELAALVGTRIGRSHWYGLLGAGRINHPDDENEASTTGLAWEFVRARPTADEVGFEFAVQGNSLGEADFWGVALGLRFGKLR